MRTFAPSSPTGDILVGGDACDVVRSFQSGARGSGLTVREHSAIGELASIVVLAMDQDPHHSPLSTASRMYRALVPSLSSDAVSIVVVHGGKARIRGPRLQRLLTGEILFQVAVAVASRDSSTLRRTMGEALGHRALEGAGIRVIRMR